MDTEWNTRTDRILKLREEQRTKATKTGFDDEQGAEMCDLVSELGKELFYKIRESGIPNPSAAEISSFGTF